MSLFDDDFYSTKVKRGSRRAGQGDRDGYRGFGGFWGTGSSRGGDRMSTVRVAVISSLVSALAVTLLIFWITGGKSSEPNARPALAGSQPIVETSERIIAASEKVRPAVVSVINITQSLQSRLEEEGWDPSSEIPDNASLGSGVIFEKKDGKAYIITNAHVIADAAVVQTVQIDGTKKEAEIIGQDVISDLAVLAIDGKGIETVAEIGQSSKLRVGEMVIAVGNPLGFGDSVTNGIISFLHRVVPVSLNQDGIYDWEQEVIQTTAAINQGNSGGVLADLNGRVIGINSMKIADMGVEGLGFALPIDSVMPVARQLMEHGKVLRPYMGVYTLDLSFYREHAAASEPGEDPDGEADEPIVPEEIKDGALVLEAVGPSKEAGLKLNDIITELDGRPIKGTLDLRKYLYNHKKIGDKLTVTFYRDGERKETTLTLAEKDKDA